MPVCIHPLSFVLVLSLLVACNADSGAPAPSNAPASAPATDTHPASMATAGPADGIDWQARGEYLVKVGGCNDCHTPDYGPRQGNVDKAQWLVGSPQGFVGPWGTTYAANLRLKLAEMDEAQWLHYSANLRTRPIMPDFALRAMSEDDRRAMYRFVRALGPAGQPAPVYLPPGQKPQPPYFELVLPPGPPPPAPSAG